MEDKDEDEDESDEDDTNDEDEKEDDTDDGTEDKVAAVAPVTVSACRAGPAGTNGSMACHVVDDEPE